MPPPTQPSLTYAVNSATSFTASVANGDAGVTNRLFYRKVGDSSDTTGPTRVGNGAFSAVTGLTSRGQYVAYVVSDDGSSFSRPYFVYVSLSSQQTLTSAIHALWDSSGAIVAEVTGGLFTGEVPEGVSPPYAWLDIDYLKPLPQMVPSQFEAGCFRLSIFAVGAQAAEEAAAVVRGVFDYNIVPFSPGTDTICVQLMPKVYALRCENLRSKDSRLMYRATLTYSVLLSSPR